MSPWISSSVGNSLERVDILNAHLSEQKIQKLKTISVRQYKHLAPEIPLFKRVQCFLCGMSNSNT